MAETTLRDTLRLAEDDIGAGRPADALTRCQHILTHYPQMLEASRVLGEAYLALGQTGEAFQAFDQVLISDPENTLAYCGRALLSQQLGDYEAALDCYYQACELSLGNRQLRLEFRRLASLANQPDFILSRVGLARLYMRGDLLAHAIREWEQILQGDPERIDAHIGLAEALWRDGQAAQAAERCRIILEAVPSCVKAQLVLGEIAYRAGQQDEASQHLEAARRQDPDGRMARELFADALVNDKAWTTFLLGEPARIPVMEEGAREALQQRDMPAPGADIMRGDSGAFAPPDFSLPFLAADAHGDGPPLREGETLEEMLAALIERPAQPESAPPKAAPRAQPPASQAADRFHTLLQSFGRGAERNNHPAAPGLSAPVSGQSDTSGLAEALLWLNATSQQNSPPTTLNPQVFSSQSEVPPANATSGTPADEALATPEPGGPGLWAEEEDTEAGWLRWLQAQGARGLDASSPDDLDEDAGPFAALLGRTDQAKKHPTKLWDAPDLEFVRSFWPSDTVPQQAVRLAPGSSARSSGSTESRSATHQPLGAGEQGDDAAALANFSSVSLRPLTLQELEQSFNASGLTRVEGMLTALAGGKSDQYWDTDFGEGPVLTIAEDDYQGRLELAERQRKTGRIDEALGHYRAIMRGAPELIDKVIAGLQESVGEGPEQAAAYRLLGDAYTRQGAYMEALEAYNRGLAASRGQ